MQMEKKQIASSRAPKAIGCYSQACSGNGIICVSGQLPIDPATGAMPEDVASQVAQAMKNLIAIVEDGGSSREKILKCCLYIRDMSQFSVINEAYGKFFGENPPARLVVEVSKLPKDAKVEIDAIAME